MTGSPTDSDYSYSPDSPPESDQIQELKALGATNPRFRHDNGFYVAVTVEGHTITARGNNPWRMVQNLIMEVQKADRVAKKIRRLNEEITQAWSGQ